MNLIAAVDSNWAIGYKNRLLVSIPADQKYFRQQTIEKVVVLGRKTLETFPNQMPLKGRTNIIMTRNEKFSAKDAVIVHSTEELLEELKKYPSEDIYIIGGESVYKELLPYCDTAEITKIDKVFDADAYFPNLDADPDWEIVADSEEQTYFDLEFRFLKYKRKSN